ncbi:hypothetical protein DFH11DRAFT_1690702 [Phellopilus nigrolimitatus]|nr:hypothetical protein DFH11DRAFT_1690702 [Phellopilus nigrolimitatus]
MDDYERWYTESSPSNRMLLSLRSGLDTEVGWALERLCRLSFNEQFSLSSIPGLVDALFEWPEWFLEEYGSGSSSPKVITDAKSKKNSATTASLFAIPPSDARHRRHALEALFVLSNAASSSKNAAELTAHPKTRPLLIRALSELDLDSDESTQFVLYVLELLQCIAGTYALPLLKTDNAINILNPVLALEKLSYESNNRSIIIGSLTVLTTLFNIPQNSVHNTASSQALSACIRFLPLFQDTALVDACLNFLYAHLSYPPMTKSFLLHLDMPNTLKLLVGYIISQQSEETATLDISAPSHTVPAVRVKIVDCEFSPEELERVGSLPEPERCFEWLRNILVDNPNEELTQVEFWNGYKDHFVRFQDRHPLLVASDVIKNASLCYPAAQAAVLPGPPQKFIIRGITRRKKVIIVERNVCQWERSLCAAEHFKTPEELHAHVKTHLNSLNGQEGNAEFTCTWASCQYSAPSFAALAPHVWTHIALKSSALTGTPSSDPAQLPKITLASASEPYPIIDATQRPPPPPQRTVVEYPAPASDPPAGALTALLVLRTLFRASFVSTDTAPRADADHFGFPGVVEEVEEQDAYVNRSDTDADREGERRGRRAFIGVRHLMEGIHIRDPALMSWIHEMVDAGSP